MEDGSFLILDNASYHSRKALLYQSTKSRTIFWNNKNVELPKKATVKTLLLALAKQHDAGLTCEVDQLAAKKRFCWMQDVVLTASQ